MANTGLALICPCRPEAILLPLPNPVKAQHCLPPATVLIGCSIPRVGAGERQPITRGFPWSGLDGLGWTSQCIENEHRSKESHNFSPCRYWTGLSLIILPLAQEGSLGKNCTRYLLLLGLKQCIRMLLVNSAVEWPSAAGLHRESPAVSFACSPFHINVAAQAFSRHS